MSPSRIVLVDGRRDRPPSNLNTAASRHRSLHTPELLHTREPSQQRIDGRVVVAGDVEPSHAAIALPKHADWPPRADASSAGMMPWKPWAPRRAFLISFSRPSYHRQVRPARRLDFTETHDIDDVGWFRSRWRTPFHGHADTRASGEPPGAPIMEVISARLHRAARQKLFRWVIFPERDRVSRPNEVAAKARADSTQ